MVSILWGLINPPWYELAFILWVVNNRWVKAVLKVNCIQNKVHYKSPISLFILALKLYTTGATHINIVLKVLVIFPKMNFVDCILSLSSTGTSQLNFSTYFLLEKPETSQNNGQYPHGFTWIFSFYHIKYRFLWECFIKGKKYKTHYT